MKSRTLQSILTSTVFATMALAPQLTAQEQKRGQPRYRLVNLGTFGGPNSYSGGSDPQTRVLNNSGAVIGYADTSIADPYAPNCADANCFVSHGFKWQRGVQADLGALPGVNSSFPNWINDKGWVAGMSNDGRLDSLVGWPELRAVLWKDGRIFDLGTLGGDLSMANALNNRGQVVGLALDAVPDPFVSPLGVPLGTQSRAFLWENGRMRDLGTLGGTDAFAELVNERGQVAGFSYTDSTVNPTTGIPTAHPFLWSNGRMLDLGTLGGTYGAPGWLNNRGQVTGFSTLAGDFTAHPFVWSKGVLTDLGTFGGDNGEAWQINDGGDVVGSADFPGSAIHHASLWKRGLMKDLGPVAGDPCSRSFGINSTDQVVGGSGDCSQFLHATLWENGIAFDLNTSIPPHPGLQLQVALNINDRGEIAGKGALLNGDLRDFLLIPCDPSGIQVPEDIAGDRCGGIQPGPAAAPIPQGPAVPDNMVSRFPGNLIRGHLRPVVAAPK